MESNIVHGFVYIFCFTCILKGASAVTESHPTVSPHILYAPVPQNSPSYAPAAPEDIKCAPNQRYVLPHSVYCDRFYACDYGTPLMYQCEDGYAFHVEKQECKLLHLVDCGNRRKLQTPRGTGLCQRLNGLYADRVHGCEKYVNCGNGTAYPTQCAGGLVFDDSRKQCKRPSSQDRLNCQKSPLVLQCAHSDGGFAQTLCSTFKCPLTNEFPFGDHARYPNPVDCKSFIICLRDGSASVHGCPDNMLFSNVHYVCVNATQGVNECYNPKLKKQLIYEYSSD